MKIKGISEYIMRLSMIRVNWEICYWPADDCYRYGYIVVPLLCSFALMVLLCLLFASQVIADESADPSFVAADLLSQAEHGTDSQVVLVAINLTDKQLDVIQVHETVTCIINFVKKNMKGAEA